MGRPRAQLSPRCAAVRERVEHWRRTRKKRSPMPGHLWDAAVALAQTDGLYATARGLRLRYASLKCHAAAVRGERVKKPAAAPAFVQLDAAPPYGGQQAAGAVVELSNGEGGQLTIRLPSAVGVDLVGLARLVLSPRA